MNYKDEEHFLLINGTVTDGLTFLDPDLCLEIRNGKIISMGPIADYEDKQIRTIDLKGRLVLPGLINPHHHLYSALATGLAPIGPTNDFNQILENLWWHLDRTLDAESIYYSAMNGLIQSIRYGVTTVVDHHASMLAVNGSLNIIKEVFQKLGLKGLLCYEVSDRMGEDRLQEQIDENVNFWEENKNADDIQGLFGLHANFTLSEKTMRMIADQKPEALPIHIHCGEDKSDFDFCREQGYEGPVHRLNEFGLLDKGSLLAHCIHMSDKDYELLNEIKPNVISNPESNANNNVGTMNIERIGAYSLGTDGMTGNILGTLRSHFLLRNGNVNEPLNVLYQHASAITDPYFPGSGKIEPGAPADLAICNYAPVTPITLDNLFYHLVFGVQGKEMHMTISKGKIIFADNKIQNIDEQEANKEIARAVKKLHGNYYA